jgi:hypothetical protein
MNDSSESNTRFQQKIEWTYSKHAECGTSFPLSISSSGQTLLDLSLEDSLNVPEDDIERGKLVPHSACFESVHSIFCWKRVLISFIFVLYTNISRAEANATRKTDQRICDYGC